MTNHPIGSKPQVKKAPLWEIATYKSFRMTGVNFCYTDMVLSRSEGILTQLVKKY